MPSAGESPDARARRTARQAIRRPLVEPRPGHLQRPAGQRARDNLLIPLSRDHGRQAWVGEDMASSLMGFLRALIAS